MPTSTSYAEQIGALIGVRSWRPLLQTEWIYVLHSVDNNLSTLLLQARFPKHGLILGGAIVTHLFDFTDSTQSILFRINSLLKICRSMRYYTLSFCCLHYKVKRNNWTHLINIYLGKRKLVSINFQRRPRWFSICAIGSKITFLKDICE